MHLGKGEHWLSLGMTGAGKTVLMLAMWAVLNGRGVWVDLKRSADDLIWQFCHVSTCHVDVLIRGLALGLKVHYIPHPDRAIGQKGAYDTLQEASRVAYTLKRCKLVCDELGAAYHGKKGASAGSEGDWWETAVIMGRSDGIGVWAASQRNQLIPHILITQVVHVTLFRLGDEDASYYKKKFSWIEKYNMQLTKDRHDWVHYDQGAGVVNGPYSAIQRPRPLRHITYAEMLSEAKDPETDPASLFGSAAEPGAESAAESAVSGRDIGPAPSPNGAEMPKL